MKRPRIIVAAALLAAVSAVGSPALAQKGGEQLGEKGVFGAGLTIGEPTGVCAKLYLGGDSDVALQGAAGFALATGGLHLHADLIWHPWILTSEDKFVLPAFLGIGVRLLNHTRDDAENDIHLGIRGVLGILFDFRYAPLDVFAEFAVVPEFRSGGGDRDHKGYAIAINAAAGVRYYF
jgi:hypothetical protein